MPPASRRPPVQGFADLPDAGRAHAGVGHGRGCVVSAPVGIKRVGNDVAVLVLVGAASLEPGILRVAGSGPLQSMVDEAAAEGRIEGLGRLETASVFDEMRRALAVVVPSIWFEGFPVVVVEAYATGTPVIASRIGSLEEIVEDGVTGLLVPPGGQTALAERMRWAVDHPQEMLQMGVNARQRYESRYRGAGHLQALIDTYHTLLELKRSVASA